ncbi:MAG: coat protein [Oscillospiraceae bacterium]|nr:coat protein [Oscillospiraceae bacterium]
MARETFFNLEYPFDSELFIQMWGETPDPILTAILESGAMVQDALIASRIQNDGNLYTIPYYNPLGGDPVNHDGRTDVPTTETTAASQSGIVYGRDKAWTARDFVSELSGADPVGHIARSVARYWSKYRQKTLINIIGAIFNAGGADQNTDDFKSQHVLTTGSPIEITDVNALMTRSMGDHRDEYNLVIMHSNVAMRLENLQVLNFWTYTDSNGMVRKSRLADWNGLTVVIDDGVPVAGNDYTTYIFGNGALRQANGALRTPAETLREPLINNGQDTLVTRIRETIHPNGFSFVIPETGWTESPTETQLYNGANWRLKFPQKSVAIAKLVTTEIVL